MNISHNAAGSPISPLRRIFSGFYDWLLILALCMVGSLPVVAFYGKPVPPGNPIYQLALLLTGIAYFSYCWMSSGQTPGMKTWYIRLESMDGKPVTLQQCLKRLLAATVSIACGGLGFWWAWSNEERLSWHDQWSRSQLKRTAKRGASPQP